MSGGDFLEKMIEEAHGWNPDRPRISEADVKAWAEPLPPGMAGAVPVTREIIAERVRQERLRTEGRFAATCATTGKGAMSDAECATVLMEEVGEVARAVLERHALAKDSHGTELRKELIQVAAVATAWVERLDEEKHLEVLEARELLGIDRRRG